MFSYRRLFAFFLRHTYPLRRDFDLLSDMVYWPLIDTLVWGVTGQWLGGTSKLLVAFMTSLVLWNVIWRSQSEVARNLMDEIWNSNLMNLFSTPLRVREWLAGVLLLSIMKMAISVGVVSLAVLLLYQVNVTNLGWWLVPFFIGATMTGWWIGLVSASIVLRYGQRMQTVIWTLPGILLPFSAIYFPLDQLPSFMQPVARLVPTMYIFEFMRGLLFSTGGNLDQLIFSFGLNTLYLVLAIIYFVRSFEYSRNLGLGRFL